MRGRSRWILKAGKLKAHIIEEDVVEEIITRLWLQYRIKIWRIRERIPGQGRLSTPGIPDLMGWVHPVPSNALFSRPVFIEVKRPGGVRRAAQIQFIKGAKEDGCIAFFAECWADVVREMQVQGGIELKEAV